ncbi:MAG: hypothetical protein AAF602_16130, partial [Myxococcota bacterium]
LVSAPVARALDAHPTANPVSLTLSYGAGQFDCELIEHVPTHAEQLARDHFGAVADRIDAERQITQRIADGARFAQLDSEVTRLRRRKRRNEAKFYRDAVNSARLGRLERMGDAFRTVRDDIRSLSTDSLLSEIDGRPTVEPFEARLDDVRTQARALYRRMRDELVEAGHTTTVGIYGPEAEVTIVHDAYAALAEGLGFSFDVARAWVRREDRKEPVIVLQETDEDEPEGDAQPIGVEIEILGAGAADLFATEAGVHAFADKPERRLLVATAGVARERYATGGRPPRPYRKSAVDARPRRVIKETRIEDYTHDLQTDTMTLHQAIQTWLTALFEHQIIEELTL